MGFMSRLLGTLSNLFQIGESGPQLKNNASVLEVRNDADAAFSKLRAASPTGNDDVVTKAYGDVAYLAEAFGGLFEEAFDEDEDSTGSSSFQQKLRLTTSNLPLDNYLVFWYLEYYNSQNGRQAEAQIELNDTTQLGSSRIEFFDPAFYVPFAGIAVLEATSGVKTIDLDYREVSGGTCYVRRARLAILNIGGG